MGQYFNNEKLDLLWTNLIYCTEEITKKRVYLCQNERLVADVEFDSSIDIVEQGCLIPIFEASSIIKEGRTLYAIINNETYDSYTFTKEDETSRGIQFTNSELRITRNFNGYDGFTWAGAGTISLSVYYDEKIQVESDVKDIHDTLIQHFGLIRNNEPQKISDYLKGISVVARYHNNECDAEANPVTDIHSSPLNNDYSLNSIIGKLGFSIQYNESTKTMQFYQLSTVLDKPSDLFDALSSFFGKGIDGIYIKALKASYGPLGSADWDQLWWWDYGTILSLDSSFPSFPEISTDDLDPNSCDAYQLYAQIDFAPDEELSEDDLLLYDKVVFYREEPEPAYFRTNIRRDEYDEYLYLIVSHDTNIPDVSVGQVLLTIDDLTTGERVLYEQPLGDRLEDIYFYASDYYPDFITGHEYEFTVNTWYNSSIGDGQSSDNYTVTWEDWMQSQ